VRASAGLPAERLWPRLDRIDAVALFALAALAATLLLANLGNQCLWQDEAQTALIARTILEHGIPHGSDGTNSFSQELGVEFGPGGVWRWHTWLSFYAVAAAFALAGQTTLAARLPFALCGVGCVLLCWALARELWRDRLAAAVAGGLLALSVPFLVLARQSRWYALAAVLALAGLFAYARIGQGQRRWALGFFVSALLLFHTHYLYCAVLLGSCGLHAVLLARERLRPTLAAAAAASVLSLPWLVWLSGVELSEGYGERLVSASQSLSYLRTFSSDLVTVFLAHGLWLLALPLLALRRIRRGEPALRTASEAWSGVALVTLHAGLGLALLAALSPGTYLRYLTPLVPPLFVLVGLVVASLARVWPALAAAAVTVWVLGGPLDDFVYEITHDYDGPIEGIVGFLNEHARPGDTVGIVYGDLPVKFYTRGLRVVGGLTGEDLEAARGADWIILRRHNMSPLSPSIRTRLRGFIDEGDYRRRVIPYPDAPVENREDIRGHRFRTARLPPVVIWEKRR
jgi:4-amino-4-deoxy-L-arabinose transferase-like glycosyltransferase